MVEPLRQVRVGSRDSELALVQARWVMSALQSAWPGLIVSLHTFKTTGDLQLEARLSAIGEKGLFTKELEVALLAGEIDIAVHSMKDMPGEVPQGLALTSVGVREDARDVLISRSGEPFEALPSASVVGTSSTRRLAMLRRLRDDLRYENIRGNLNTRLRKLEEGQYDAIVLAAAGVNRLGWQHKITHHFDPETQLVPAPCQGILAVEYRVDAAAVVQALQPLVDEPTQAATVVERTVLVTLQAGCHTPLGVYASVNSTTVFGMATLLSPQGRMQVTACQGGELDEAEWIGRELARCLLAEKSTVQG